MKNIKVGINGFGRIGRSLFRVLHNRNDIQVIAINDIAEPNVMAHLLKYDSIHGVFDAEISATHKSISVNGKPIRYSQQDSLEKLKYDLYYIKHRSIFLDFSISIKTLSTILYYLL